MPHLKNLSVVHALNPLASRLRIPGASPGFGRGGPRIFFLKFGNLHVAKRHAARMAKPCALVGGFGGMLPREIF